MFQPEKYRKIYQELKNSKREDILQAVITSEDEEEKEFFRMIYNYLISKQIASNNQI